MKVVTLPSIVCVSTMCLEVFSTMATHVVNQMLSGNLIYIIVCFEQLWSITFRRKRKLISFLFSPVEVVSCLTQSCWFTCDLQVFGDGGDHGVAVSLHWVFALEINQTWVILESRCNYFFNKEHCEVCQKNHDPLMLKLFSLWNYFFFWCWFLTQQ